jgi:Domain of unknown function (DUF4920)
VTNWLPRRPGFYFFYLCLAFILFVHLKTKKTAMMKSLILFFVLLAGLVPASRAQQKSPAATQVFGQSFSPARAVAARDLPRVLGRQDSLAVQVIGQVQDVCQVKGCWMDVRLADNTVMKVRFQDYAFFVPKNLKGKTVVLNGRAFNQTMSVADQRHYAQDAGKPAAEVQAIKAPRQTITYTATGVLVK